jgi:hypothetical protein
MRADRGTTPTVLTPPARPVASAGGGQMERYSTKQYESLEASPPSRRV